jgi:subtilisin family serine protease
MQRHFFIFTIVALLGLIEFSHAETSTDKNDPLKKLLEEKFIPPPTERPTTFDKKDYHPIAPPKQNSPQPGRGGQLAPHSGFSLALNLSAINAKPRSPLRPFTDNRVDGGFLIMAKSGEFFQPNGRAHSSPAQESFVVAQQGPPAGSPGAMVNVYLIQLNPNATEQQISAILRKYDLTPIGGVAGLHILRVRGKEVAIGSAQGQAQNPFTQKILADLRREAIVQAAAVDTTLTTRSVPRPVNTSVNNGGISYRWTWKNDSTPPPGPGDLSSSIPVKSMDGNWGLKTIRMPPVWTIIQRYRAANPNLARPKVAIIDTGFSHHEDLNFNAIRTPNDPTAPPTTATTILRPCEPSGHGNHVAGIIGATHGNGLGVDGIVPQAKMDAVVALTAESLNQDPILANTAADSRISLFGNVLPVLYSYMFDTSATADLRVVNVSLGYNIPDPASIPGLDKNIANQAIMFAGLARRFEKSVLFVTAAGNDSEGRTTPLDAKWSSPIVWAATEVQTADGPLKNVIVVEASNHFGERAAFSNLSKSGSVSAPGLDILSTLLPDEQNYYVCDGTSQAAPHVSGVAALLFELDPTKKPAEIAEIIRTSAIKPSKAPGIPVAQGAPRLDALEAVLKLSPDNLSRLADLNRDGKVDIDDMKIFAKQITALANNRTTGAPFTEDLNGDGVIDANECNWPFIDLNGSGTSSLSLADAKIVQGKYRTDLDVMALAWTDKTKSFYAALKETSLDVAQQAADKLQASSVSPQACR